MLKNNTPFFTLNGVIETTDSIEYIQMDANIIVVSSLSNNCHYDYDSGESPIIV